LPTAVTQESGSFPRGAAGRFRGAARRAFVRHHVMLGFAEAFHRDGRVTAAAEVSRDQT